MNFRLLNQPLENHESSGMSLLEMLLSISMLIVFTGVVAMVMQFTLLFFSESESGNSNSFSNGVLIDHRQLHIAMDALVEVLSQPGVRLANISYSQEDRPVDVCTYDPVGDWGLEEDFMDANEINDLLPYGYRMCLWKTTKTGPIESVTSPSIYLLQALPEKRGPSGLPTRRFFCSSRPVC